MKIDAFDNQLIGEQIEAWVRDEEMSYLDASTRWIEEHDVSIARFAKFIPSVIVDKIREESIRENKLRPSHTRTEKQSSLDFLL